MILRPLEHLNAAMTLYPNAARMVDEFRSERGKKLPKWPAWCFLPMAAWYAMVCEGNNVAVLGPNLIGDVAQLAAIGTWRYSQGIYRIDSDMLAALTESQVSGPIPSEVLYRLPEWSMYFETPGRQWAGSELYGYWAHLEWDANTERSELRLLLDSEAALVPIPLHIGDWIVTEAVERAVTEAATQAARLGLPILGHSRVIETVSREITPLISILLYVCSEEPEIDDEREPGSSPSRPQPKKTKNGWRLFPAQRPRIWTVGKKLGEHLRGTAQNYSAREVRAHLRRGHWHGFWTGPRDGQRKFIYRWLHPMVVAGGE